MVSECFDSVSCVEGIRSWFTPGASGSKKSPKLWANAPPKIFVTKEVDIGNECKLKVTELPDSVLGGRLWPSGICLAHWFGSGQYVKDLAESGITNFKSSKTFEVTKFTSESSVVTKDSSTRLEKFTILEIGAGVGLPGIAAAKCGAASYVSVTDRADLLALAQQNVELNGVGDVVKVQELDWFDVAGSDVLRDEFDIVIGADIVYWEEQDPLMHCLKDLLKPSTIFVLAYRNRTELDKQYLDDTILPNFEYRKIDYATPDDVCCEIYICKLKAST